MINREYNINSNTEINDSNNIGADNDNSKSHNSIGNGDYETYFWNEVSETVFEKYLNDAYEKIVYWKRNLLMMPSRAGRKRNNSSFESLDSKLVVEDNYT